MPITVKNSAGGGVTLDSSTSSNETINLNTPVFTGNVGVGVTPESSYAGRPTLRIGSGLAIGGYGSNNPSHNWINANAYQAASDATEKYIGTDQASQIKQTNGAFTFNVAPNGSADSAISWNTAMTINNAGIVTIPNQPAFTATGTASWTVVTNAQNQPMVMSNESFDKNNDYNPSTYKFTAPVAGTYLFTLQTYTRRTSGGGGDYIYIGFNINNAKPSSAGYTQTILHYIDNGTADIGTSLSAIYALSAGDTVHANIYGSSSNCAYHGPSCSWGGHLIG